MFSIENERPDHAAEIEELLDEAFGPGRYAKTAQRLREGNAPAPGLSYVAFSGEGEARRMVGALSFWPILIGGAPALMLGPLAVKPELRGKGCGIQLMERGLADAKRLGHRIVILVGDAPYYARVGFGPVPPGRVLMPGPVDLARLLYRELDIGAFSNVSGAVTKPDGV
ncbi:GNAT family N-acetyltransferase [Tepidicaulis sp. LMO-SS28]|uniref:GNAT family N-acetyltransferase n=1 Tax=Tepidicaulis sp. LMO-SS28 TaxID=3447455 RepID=UPI003EE080AF